MNNKVGIVVNPLKNENKKRYRNEKNKFNNFIDKFWNYY